MGILLTFYSLSASCQINKVPGGSRYNNTSGTYVSTLANKPVTNSGEVHWLDEPQKAIIVLINNDSLLYPINIRIDNPGIEIHYDNAIKVLPMSLIKSVRIGAHHYVTNKYFKNVKLLPGFYEVFILDRYSLLGQLDYTVQAVNYNVQLDVGETNARAIKETKYYIISPTFGVLDLQNTKKKRIKTFFSYPLKTEEYIKKEKIKVGKLVDLQKWVTYENSSSH